MTFDALSAGAFDYVPKQMSPVNLDITHIRPDLLAKIRAAGMARRPSRFKGFRKPACECKFNGNGQPHPALALVTLGASTGGPKALEEILPRFPRDLSVPILMVLHLPVGFTEPFAKRLDKRSDISVKEARHHEVAQQGVAYVAPAGIHLRVERMVDSGPLIVLDSCPAGATHTPSIDELMISAADAYRDRVMGVVMTGMGCDGAEGIKAISREGGLTIAQNEASCAVYGMPRTCAECGVLREMLPLEQIPEPIVNATRRYERT